MSSKKQIKFIDLFAGIGGFHLAMHKLNAKCVFASEKDQMARRTYFDNFRKISPNLFKNDNQKFNIDILDNNLSYSDIPDFDILCAGFPCQPFSQAGKKRGFNENIDARGNMFFVIRDIIKSKKPRAIFLENVRHLINHDKGNTFKVIKETIENELNYSFNFKIMKASDYGLPQNRPRVFIVGFKDEKTKDTKFKFPEKIKLKKTMSDIMNGFCNKDIGYTIRVGGQKSPFEDRRNWDGYIVDGKQRRLNINEAKKMMGLPVSFKFPVSDAQAFKQLGNSVAIPAIKLTAQNIIDYLLKK